MLSTDFKRHIDHPQFDNQLLSFDCTPAHLWVRIQQCAQFIGFHGQVLAAPRDNQHTPQVQQLTSSLLPQEEEDASIPIDKLLAAISSSGPTCFFCHDPCHTAEKCPLLLCTKSDPFAKRIVLRLLQDSTAKSMTPSSDHTQSSISNTHQKPQSTPQVHALNIDEDDESIHLVTPQSPMLDIASTTFSPTADNSDLDFQSTC